MSCDKAESSTATPSRQAERQAMVRTQIEARGIRDELVLRAMRTVPRHEFVPTAVAEHAYADQPLPIGEGQTISQPYIVALMTDLAEVKPSSRVLDIGTGSGYQAAVLAAITDEVYSIEIIDVLAKRADQTLRRLGYRVHVRSGDGYAGWPKKAPFDAIIVAAAPPSIPKPLIEQLAPGGRLVIPVGTGTQELMLVERSASGIVKKSVIPVRFVPMTGRAQDPSNESK